MGNVACHCKKNEVGQEINVEEPIISKGSAEDQSARENGLSVPSENNMEENIEHISSRNQKSLIKSNSKENMIVEINQNDRYDSLN
jgi:hypothetical protein